MVYIWGFSCLDYSFDVLTSQIGNLGLYNWFYHIYLLLFTYSYMLMLTIRFSCSLTRIYRYTCAYLCTPLGIHRITHWGVLTPLDLHIQILELGLWWTSWWSELRTGRVMDQQLTVLSPILPGPCSSLWFSFCNSWAYFVLFILVYLFVFSHLCHWWCDVLVILCHILW